MVLLNAINPMGPTTIHMEAISGLYAQKITNKFLNKCIFNSINFEVFESVGRLDVDTSPNIYGQHGPIRIFRSSLITVSSTVAPTVPFGHIQCPKYIHPK